MKFILGIKENMTELFSENGNVVPVTVVSAGPVTVTRVFEKTKDARLTVYFLISVGSGIGPTILAS